MAVDFTSHAEMDQGVVLLSFRHLGSFRQKKSSKPKTVSRSNTKSILQLKSLATLFNKLLPTRKLKTEKVLNHKVLYSKKVVAEKYNFENEIERFQRDFVLPLERWEAATTASETYSEREGKFSSDSTSDFDSGHFSGDLESGCFSSSVSTISSVSDRKAGPVLECR